MSEATGSLDGGIDHAAVSGDLDVDWRPVGVAVAAVALVTLVLALLSPELRPWWWLIVVFGWLGVATETIRSAPWRVAHAQPHTTDSETLVLDAQERWRPPADASGTPVVPSGHLARQPAPTVSPGFADVLWVPKSSHSPDEHEDAWAIDPGTGRAALSDGASSAFMAREWAVALTEAFVARPPRGSSVELRGWLDEVTRRWTDQMGRSAGEWWVDASHTRGSFATLVGITFGPGASSGTWNSIAVGDSCVVHLVRDDRGLRRLAMHPVDHPAGFGRHPDLLSTTKVGSDLPVAPDPDVPAVRRIDGEYRQGDVFLLLSDALAHWAIAHEIDDPDSWSWLTSMQPEEFHSFVVRERSSGALEDDDTTLVRLRPDRLSRSGHRDDSSKVRPSEERNG